MYIIFFFKQKTAYEMRISDWSSDVCSSDLHLRGVDGRQPQPGGIGALAGGVQRIAERVRPAHVVPVVDMEGEGHHVAALCQRAEQGVGRRASIGRASGGERVCESV